MTEWIDLGDGEAISPSRVSNLRVVPPVEPRYRMPAPFLFLDYETWGVELLDSRDSVVHRLGYFWTEAQARQLAQRIVDQMIKEAAT